MHKDIMPYLIDKKVKTLINSVCLSDILVSAMPTQIQKVLGHVVDHQQKLPLLY